MSQAADILEATYDGTPSKPEKRKQTDSEAPARKKKKRKHAITEDGDAQVEVAQQELEELPAMLKNNIEKKGNKSVDEEELDGSLQPKEPAHPDIDQSSMKKKHKKKDKKPNVEEEELELDISLKPDQRVDFHVEQEPSTIWKKKHKKKDKKPAVIEEEPLELDTSPHEQQRDSDVELPEAHSSTDSTTIINATTSPAASPSPSPSLYIPPPNFTTTTSTPFHNATLSLYVALPAISLNTPLPSLISTHLTPLLLTYYAPAAGIVLAITDESISSLAAPQVSKPLILPSHPNPEVEYLAQCADDAGVSWVWLSARFLIFRPERGAELEGYVNIASEDFIGLILYNYFQVGIPKIRVPQDWEWRGPGGAIAKSKKKKGRKGLLNDDHSGSLVVVPDSQATASSTISTSTSMYAALGEQAEETTATNNTGAWVRPDGSPVKENTALRFRVVDCDVVPAHTREREKFALQIDGTLLDEEEERKVVEVERARFDRIKNRLQHGMPTLAGKRDGEALMSGGLGVERGFSSREYSLTPSVVAVAAAASRKKGKEKAAR